MTDLVGFIQIMVSVRDLCYSPGQLRTEGSIRRSKKDPFIQVFPLYLEEKFQNVKILMYSALSIRACEPTYYANRRP